MICHSARISSENIFTVTNYVNQGCDSAAQKRKNNFNLNEIFVSLLQGCSCCSEWLNMQIKKKLKTHLTLSVSLMDGISDIRMMRRHCGTPVE